MLLCTEPSHVHNQVRAWRAQGLRIALVPTMGNLHEGHYSLIDLARAQADRVVASVFVNPTQFGPGEDYARYPRTPEVDRGGLAERGCDLLFAPGVEGLYPNGVADSTEVRVAGVTGVLEGAFRPGHFVGVASVVARLFVITEPDIAVFGQKDYQQLLTIKRMVTDLGFRLSIVTAPTRRESSGLAMSSRNQYLSAVDRERAALIFTTLQSMRASLQRHEPVADIENTAAAALAQAGFANDYVAVRDAEDLTTVDRLASRQLVALIATRLGATRLIDNLLIDPQS